MKNECEQCKSKLSPPSISFLYFFSLNDSLPLSYRLRSVPSPRYRSLPVFLSPFYQPFRFLYQIADPIWILEIKTSDSVQRTSFPKKQKEEKKKKKQNVKWRIVRQEYRRNIEGGILLVANVFKFLRLIYLRSDHQTADGHAFFNKNLNKNL